MGWSLLILHQRNQEDVKNGISHLGTGIHTVHGVPWDACLSVHTWGYDLKCVSLCTHEGMTWNVSLCAHMRYDLRCVSLCTHMRVWLEICVSLCAHMRVWLGDKSSCEPMRPSCSHLPEASIQHGRSNLHFCQTKVDKLTRHFTASGC